MIRLAHKTVEKLHTSKALWLPTVWLFLACSRPVSLWTHIQTIGTAADDQLEGSPLDRAIFTLLILGALIVLIGRGRRIANLLRANLPILLFLAYCGISIFWSDFSDVAFKRWIRVVGDVAMVSIVLSEVSPLAGIKTLLARLGFVILPLSVLFDIGRGFSGLTYHNGLTTNKNLYGAVAMVLGLAAVWRFLTARQNPERSKERINQLIAFGGLSLLALFCLWMANSATSIASFGVGIIILVIARRWSARSKPRTLHLLTASLILLAVYVALLNPNAGIVSAMGKDPTLTGRTEVWQIVIPMNPNPLLGAGFESFWLGPRLKHLWNIFVWKPNEAHNGYIELYLNLGWVGLALLAAIIVTGYRRNVGILRKDPELGSLKLAYLVAVLVYSMAEAGFRMFSPIWLAFLFSTVTIATPKRREAGNDSKRVAFRNVSEAVVTERQYQALMTGGSS